MPRTRYDLINLTRYKKNKEYHVIDTNDTYIQLIESARYMYANSGQNYGVVEHDTQEVVFETGEW
jgi:hypothetical protein